LTKLGCLGPFVVPEHICHMLLGNGEVYASAVSLTDLRFIAFFGDITTG